VVENGRGPLRVGIFFVLVTSLVACNRDTAHNSGLEASNHLTRPPDTAQKTTRPDTLSHADPETLAVAAKDPAATGKIARIEPFRARLDSLLDSKNPEVLSMLG
jgi:hypothetical protein